MNGTAREELKESAWGLITNGTSPEVRAEGYLMLIEAHYHRNSIALSFPLYAEQWLAANSADIDLETFALLVTRYPAPHVRMIAEGYSDWGSYGHSSYK